MRSVFFSWQSDSSRKHNKNLIFSCLEKAIREINKELQLVESERGDAALQADQDTQDVPGHPDIFTTILSKIENSEIFIPDFTLTAQTAAGKKVPNPNVMIEYGYALKALGPHRIIPIMNNHYGDFDSLPFDLRTKRAPLGFNLAPDSEQAVIDQAKEALTQSLIRYIRLALGNSKPLPSKPIPTVEELLSQYIHSLPSMNHLIERDNVGGQKPFVGIFLLTIPSGSWDVNKLKVKEKSNVLKPFGRIEDGYRTHRWPNGLEVYEWLDRPSQPPKREEDIVRKSFTKLFYDGVILGFDRIRQHFSEEELRSIDCNGLVIPGYIEKYMEAGLRDYLSFYKSQTSFSTPIRVVVGIYNVYGYRLGLPSGYTDKWSDKILEGAIIYSFEVKDFDEDISSALNPFFEKIWIEAGMERPVALMDSLKKRQ